MVLGLLAATTLVGLLLEGFLSLTSQALLYVLAVVVASYTVPLWLSLACAGAAVTLLNFFFVEPRYTFHVDAQENLVALFTLLTLAVLASHLGTSMRRETEAARLNEARARQLQELATALASAASPHEAALMAQRLLHGALCKPTTVAPLTAEGQLMLSCETRSNLRDGMLACVREGTTLGPGTGRWPAVGAWFIPLRSENHVTGAACIEDVSDADESARDHAQAICALAGQALWRLQLADSMRQVEEQAQWHRAQNTFLASISHDFRTPLAAVVAAASSLQMQRQKLSDAEQQRLLQVVLNEAEHLSTLTENTLQLARLENAGALSMDWQSIEEVVGSVLARVRQRDETRRIRSRVPPNIPLIKGDPVLLTQLLENLLDNALKYSADAVELAVSREDGAMLVTVEDRGAGIPAGEEETIFEPYRRSDHSGRRGAGLGLALCQAIARAHGGSLEARRRDSGGSSFVLKLPLDAAAPMLEAA